MVALIYWGKVLDRGNAVKTQKSWLHHCYKVFTDDALKSKPRWSTWTSWQAKNEEKKISHDFTCAKTRPDDVNANSNIFLYSYNMCINVFALMTNNDCNKDCSDFLFLSEIILYFKKLSPYWLHPRFDCPFLENHAPLLWCCFLWLMKFI